MTQRNKMSIFNIFRKKPPTQTLLELRHVAVLASLTFREHTNESNHELSANAGAELLYFLLHITDTFMHQHLTPVQRASYFDALTLDSISSYADAMLSEKTPRDLRASAKEMMLRRFNSRQRTYSRCKSFNGNGFPSAGSKLFALAFLAHRALGRTERVQFDQVLAGNEPIGESELPDFPTVPDIVLWSAFATGSIEDMKLKRAVRALK